MSHVKFYLSTWSLGIWSGGIESGLQWKERPATNSLRDDSAGLQFDSHFRTQSLGRRSGLVRSGVGAAAVHVSERCMVPVLQGKAGTHAGQLRKLFRLVYKIVEESECLAALPSYLFLGIDVGALLAAAVEQGDHVCHDADERIQLVAHHLHVPEGCDSTYGETVELEWGETAGRQPDDAGTNL